MAGTSRMQDVLAGVGAPPDPIQVADALTRGHSAGLLVGAAVGVVGVPVAVLFVRGGRVDPAATPPPLA